MNPAEHVLLTAPPVAEQHCLLAIDHQGNVWDYGLTSDYETTVTDWYEADDARRAGRRPHVRHYEVRSADDPKARSARRSYGNAHFKDTLTPRGRKDPSVAARFALKAIDPDPRQGVGGWFWLNGITLTQGLHGPGGLTDIAQRRGWIAQDAVGKWHVAV